MAELKDGKVINDTRIMENIELYRAISFTGGWSADSKTVYIKTAVESEDYVGDIAVFEVTQ